MNKKLNISPHTWKDILTMCKISSEKRSLEIIRSNHACIEEIIDGEYVIEKDLLVTMPAIISIISSWSPGIPKESIIKVEVIPSIDHIIDDLDYRADYIRVEFREGGEIYHEYINPCFRGEYYGASEDGIMENFVVDQVRTWRILKRIITELKQPG